MQTNPMILIIEEDDWSNSLCFHFYWSEKEIQLQEIKVNTQLYIPQN